MELDAKMTLFAEMLGCKYPVYLFEYDSNFVLRASNCPDAEFLDKLFTGSGNRERMQAHLEDGTTALLLSSAMGVLWGGVFHRVDGVPATFYLLGPVLCTEMNAADAETELQYYLDTHQDEKTGAYEKTVSFKAKLMKALGTLPIVATSRFVEDVLMLAYYTTGQKLGRGELITEQEAGERKQSKRKSDRHRTWMAEQALLHMVREGDLNYRAALQNAASVSEGVPVRVKGSLQQAQVSAITLITLCVRAAIDGGLTPDTAYSVGDGYVQQALEKRTITDIVELNHTMYDDFVRRVHKARTNAELPPQIQSCIDYMELHVEDKFGVAELARLTGYTEYYLSRKFKEATQCSINDYIKIIRVEHAKLLLYTTRDSINKIAARLYFCSGSYFAATFQRFVGVSPAEYRRQHKK